LNRGLCHRTSRGNGHGLQPQLVERAEGLHAHRRHRPTSGATRQRNDWRLALGSMSLGTERRLSLTGAPPASARDETAEDTMRTAPVNASSLPGRPPVVDLATWQTARAELLVREKAHTREGDAIAADRRRLPMVEVDGAVEVNGADGGGPVPDMFLGP